ncbi:MAG TPA: hypothetical protein VNE17_13300 [Nitrolancea sp.]|nr:hypothetical protein [Nitrolancea sp.]
MLHNGLSGGSILLPRVPAETPSGQGTSGGTPILWTGSAFTSGD